MTDADERSTVIDKVIQMAAVYDLPSIATRGQQQSIQTEISGEVSDEGGGTILVTVTAVGMVGSPKTISVDVEDEDTAYLVAIAISTALTEDEAVAGFFDITRAGIRITLAAKTAAANDATMNLAIALGTAVGINPDTTSSAVTVGSARDISNVESIVDRNKRATRWVAGRPAVVGQLVLPPVPNGRIYTISVGGMFGSEDPFSSTLVGSVSDNGVVMLDRGEAPDFAYDTRSAVAEVWALKAGEASRFMGSGGMNMSKLFENCMKMSRFYQRAMVG